MELSEEFIIKTLQGIKLDGDINILLLGETGVGKSTFINAIANYCEHKTWKNAETKKLSVVIPMKFTIRDKFDKDHEVKIGDETPDKNEHLSTGASSTQGVQTYVFPLWNKQYHLRLIDTPGMGDTRGIHQDNLNCENILTYISRLHELHAICFIFKPQNSRLTAFFNYCMNQILSRLEKSAVKNLTFVFTNTRGTDYGPGETLSLLQEVVKEIKEKPPHADISLTKNIFCFDNEPLRYLAALEKGISFEDSVRERNMESWNKSIQQWFLMMKYILGVKPHFIKSTMSINEARRLIIQLSQPLAEITQHINDNIYTLQRHERNLSIENQSLQELKEKLYMPVVNLKVTKLTQPVTVCASNKCLKIYKVGDQNKYHYEQRCHDPCFLPNVPAEIIGSPELVNCAAMDRSSKMCKQCTCDFSVHMHIYYMTEAVEEKIIDKTVQQNITTKEQMVTQKMQLIHEMDQRKRELENEHKTIVNVTAHFSHFLQNNAITPFNDSYKSYIQYLIEREKSLGNAYDPITVQHLEKLLREYEETKKTLDEAAELHKKLGRDDSYVTAKQINKDIDDLYKLKYNGKKIKELYESQKTSRGKEYTFNEIVLKNGVEMDFSSKKAKEAQAPKNEQATCTSGGNKKQNQSTQNTGANRQNQRRNRGTSAGPASRRNYDAPPSYEEHVNHPRGPPRPPAGPPNYSPHQNYPPGGYGHPPEPAYPNYPPRGHGADYRPEPPREPQPASYKIEVNLTDPRASQYEAPRDPYQGPPPLIRDPYQGPPPLMRDPYQPRDPYHPQGGYPYYPPTQPGYGAGPRNDNRGAYPPQNRQNPSPNYSRENSQDFGGAYQPGPGQHIPANRGRRQYDNRGGRGRGYVNRGGRGGERGANFGGQGGENRGKGGQNRGRGGENRGRGANGGTRGGVHKNQNYKKKGHDNDDDSDTGSNYNQPQEKGNPENCIIS